MTMNSDRHLVIFDFDGTLFDSMGFWDTLALSDLNTHGLEPDQTLLDNLPTMTMREVADYLASHHPVLGNADAIFTAWKRRAYEAFRNELPFKPGASELVADLARRGRRLAIATMSERAIVELALQRFEHKDCFETLVTFEDVGVGKHEPAIWLEVIRRLGANPSACTVIEDAYFAARTAKMAGFHVVAVAEPVNDAYAEQLKELADRYVDSLAELVGQL